MNNSPYKLKPVAKSIKVILSAVILSSVSANSIAATEIGSGGININGNAADAEYFVAPGTIISGNSTTAPVIFNDYNVTAVTNDGKIDNAGGTAVLIQDMANTFLNNSQITAKEYGVDVQGGSTLGITNTGTISGESAGVHIGSNAAITNSGTIGSADSLYGVLVDTGSTTITNTGNIIGSKAAIQLNTTGNQLILRNKSALTGDVITSAIGNKITLMDAGSEDSNFIGSGSGLGFSLLDMRGTEWTLDGNIDLVNAGATPSLKVTTGNLILTGEVNNAGDSLINTGAGLQLGDGSKTALFNGATLTNNGTLTFNQGGDSELSTNVTGSGSLIKKDSNTLTLSGKNNITGTTTLNAGNTLITGELTSAGTTINSGALLATNGMLASDIVINAGGTLSSWEGVSGNSGSSTNTITGNVTNSGTLNLAAASNTPGVTMTIDGDYQGVSGSKLIMNTEAGDDSSLTDHLLITKNSSGTSSVSITNIGGAGAQTVNGIEVISVGGVSDATFDLASPVTVGKWEYDLKKKDNNWYLVSEKPEEPDTGGNTPPDDGGTAPDDGGKAPDDGGKAPDDGGSVPDDGGKTPPDNSPQVLAPETSAYLGNYMAAQQMFIHKRDDREQLLARAPDQNSGWMYVRGRYNESNVDGGRGSYDTTTHVIQLGSDLFSGKLGEGEWHTGFMLGTGLSTTHADAKWNARSAKGHVNGYNVGLYSTWQEDPNLRLGSYVDSWVSASWYDSWVNGDRQNREKYSSKGIAASVETGYAWLLDSSSNRHWKVEPQGQVVFSYLDQNDHTESDGTRISAPDNNSYLTRLGVRLSNVDQTKPGAWQPFVAANWLNGAGMNTLKFNGESAHDNTPNNRGQLEVGISGDMNEVSTVSLRAIGEWGDNSYNAWGGHIMWNYRW